MFTPETQVTLEGEIDGIHIRVGIATYVDETDAIPNGAPTIVDCHNVATMILVAVNEVFKVLESPADVPKAPPSNGPRLVDMNAFKKSLTDVENGEGS